MKDISTLIEIDHKGRPRIAGRRIWVHDVVFAHITHGEPIAELSDGYGLSPEEIYAALAYYYLNMAEIVAQIEQSEREVEQFIKDNPDIIFKAIN